MSSLSYQVWVDNTPKGVHYGKPSGVIRAVRGEYGGRKVTIEGADLLSEAVLNHRIRTVRFSRRLDDRAN